MSTTLKIRGNKKRFIWLLGFLLLVLCYFTYYQLWYKSKLVNSNIFTLEAVLHGHIAEIWTVKFSPNGTWLASGSVDSTIKIWNKDNGNVILTLKQPQGITYLDFSPDGNYLVSASYDSKIRLWKFDLPPKK